LEKEKIKLLAKKIIELDVKRDELYEELIITGGSKAAEYLRYLQNSK
jgi:hypothetical protein